MSLPIKKLYLDSRYRRNDSLSTSSCKFELKQQIHLPLNCIAYIDDIQIPHTWYNVSSTSNKLYVRLANIIPNGHEATIDTDKIIRLDTGNYSLADLAANLKMQIDAAYLIIISCTANIRRGTISITAPSGKAIRIFSEEEIASDVPPWMAHGQNNPDRTNPQSANDMFGITGTTVYTDHPHAFETQFINLRPVHNIYVTSPNLGSFDTLGPRGEQNIIKKVPVSSDWGYVVFDSVVSEHDYIDVSNGFFKVIELVLRDSRGNVIDLNNGHWSLSIVFSMMKEKDI